MGMMLVRRRRQLAKNAAFKQAAKNRVSAESVKSKEETKKATKTRKKV